MGLFNIEDLEPGVAYELLHNLFKPLANLKRQGLFCSVVTFNVQDSFFDL